jgi:hypothetical protein
MISITATKTRTAPRNFDSSGDQGDAPKDTAAPESTFGGSAPTVASLGGAGAGSPSALAATRCYSPARRSAQRLVTAVPLVELNSQLDIVDCELLASGRGDRDGQAGGWSSRVAVTAAGGVMLKLSSRRLPAGR